MDIAPKWVEDAYLIESDPTHSYYFMMKFLPWPEYQRTIQKGKIVPAFLHSYGRAHTYLADMLQREIGGAGLHGAILATKRGW
eukprot:253744-Karenia_brevis.AAC.1